MLNTNQASQAYKSVNTNYVSTAPKASKHSVTSTTGRKQYTLPFKTFVAEVYLSNTISYSRLAKQHNVSIPSVILWVDQYRDGRLVAGNAVAFSTMPQGTQGRAEALVNTSRAK